MAQQPLVGQDLFISEAFTITLRRTTVGRASLDEWSARRKHLYLTTHNTHKRQTFILRAGFKPTVSAGDGRRCTSYTARPLGPTRQRTMDSSVQIIILRWLTILMLLLGDDAVLSELGKNLLPPSSGKLRNLWKSNPLSCVVHYEVVWIVSAPLRDVLRSALTGARASSRNRKTTKTLTWPERRGGGKSLVFL
jgi:hypothetical protein